MNNIRNTKTFRVILSILVALIIWLYVENIDPSIIPLQVRDIPVEFIGEDDILEERGLMVSSDKNVTVDLTLEGQRNMISSLGRGKGIRIQVDLSGITTTGQHSLEYNIIYPDSVSERNITVASASPYRVTVDVVELYKKSITVRGERTGEAADGYMAGEMTFSEDTILVSGEQLSVSNISHALVSVDLTGATETVNQAASIQLIDFNGDVVDSTDLRMSTDSINVSVPILMIKELPLVIDFVSSPGSMEADMPHSITPRTITVAGDSKSISKLDQIVLSQVVLKEITQNTSYTVPIPIPAGSINLSGETTATVTISSMNLETTTFTVTNLRSINEPAGKTVRVVTNEVDVVLRGPAEELETIEDFNIRIVGDMTDVTASNGNYAIPAEVYVDGNGKVGAIGTYQITVRISS